VLRACNRLSRVSCTGAAAEEARVTELPPLAVLQLHVAADLAEAVEVQLPDEAGEVVVLEHRRDQLLCKFLRVLGGGETTQTSV